MTVAARPQGPNPPLLSRLTPAHQVLFAAGNRRDPQVSLELDDHQWAMLCQTAEREKAASAAWRYVKARLGDVVLPDGADRLRKLATVMDFRMLFLEQRLAESVAALRTAGIPCVLLKGAALASSYYPRFADRPMLDLDVLVPRESARDALLTLLDAGWRTAESDEKFRTTNASLHHLPVLYHASGVEVNLEVHFEVISTNQPFAWTAADVWDTAVPRTGTLLGASIPSAEQLILHACVHFAWGHMLRTGGWRTFRDIEVVMDRGEVNWDNIIALARRTRAQTCVYWTLRLGARVIGLPVPPAVLKALRPPLAAVALNLVERHLVAVMIPGGVDCPSVRVRRRAWELAFQPEWSGHGSARPWLTDVASGDADEIADVSGEGVEPAGPSVWADPRAGGRGRQTLAYARQLLRI